MIAKFSHLIPFLFIAVFLSSASVANDGCQPVSDGNWQVVGESCDVGQGLWSTRPEREDGRFWVQCGLFNRSPPASFSDLFPRDISLEKLVFRTESSQYRCLLGPFMHFSEAAGVKAAVRQSDAFSLAFIREVKKPPRRYLDIAGMKSPMPKVDEPRYSDQHNVWWRATLQEAKMTCATDNMNLVSEQTLKELIAIPTAKEELSSPLPFWVADGNAFDADTGISIPLSKASALLVLCEPKLVIREMKQGL
ncbi:SPOR domain-containing protein [Grimontia hollisae]|uniref:SPOR domain-containing protein n=2 Tax=Grimontia hollisae TaxID=673 RepID=D0I4D6_GRIHO|nr:SPOR domain-containing protein [Grimontia hollisae]AMG30565.1 SPOR domain-containing protein [Grimontia hollisae]EEY73914.1 hypothetical protein VHA_000601 [Grimontia hollisae CIP 101886]STO41824.1 Uncharacterised protein [Grimontia hollisae]STO55749.1 Uncharacterised protein [Grimontia hollisae]